MPFLRQLKKAGSRALAAGVVSGAKDAIKSGFRRMYQTSGSGYRRPIRPSLKKMKRNLRRRRGGMKTKKYRKRYTSRFPYSGYKFARAVERVIHQGYPKVTFVKHWADVQPYVLTSGNYTLNYGIKGDTHGWALFSPEYVLDAASTAFASTKKAQAYNWTTTTNNITGRPKIWVDKNIATFEFRNTTRRVLELEMYVIDPKDISTTTSTNLSTDLNNVLQKNGSGVTVDIPGYYPEQFKSLRKQYKFTKRYVKLSPGKHYSWTVYGRTGIYNLTNLTTDDVQPGYTRYFWMRSRPVFTGGSDEATNPSTEAGFLQKALTAGAGGEGLVMYQRNEIQVRCPEGVSNANTTQDYWYNLRTNMDNTSSNIKVVNWPEPSVLLTNPGTG